MKLYEIDNFWMGVNNFLDGKGIGISTQKIILLFFFVILTLVLCIEILDIWK